MEVNKIYQGNCLEVLKQFPDNSINCCITSPPYYGLRDYGTGTWIGGDVNCPHRRLSKYSDKTTTGHAQEDLRGNVGDAIYKTVCKDCGAVRVDDQIGLEETPEQYIEKLVSVFREVRRVLADDGVLWVNIGDTYWGSGGGRGSNWHDSRTDVVQSGNKGFNDMLFAPVLTKSCGDLKPKDLIGIPWMLAFALRADGWYLRQDIIWAKPNPMPESVKDRCTKSHEYVFMLTKNREYYFNYESMQEETFDHKKRNKRDVWSVIPAHYKVAHFATFPEQLVYPMVKSTCPKDGIVLDPFMGSGTVGVVAKQNNCNYVGIELNDEYVKMAERRIKKYYKEVILMRLFEIKDKVPSKTLIDSFVVPPFSTLDTRLGYWQDRKRMWNKYLGDAGETRDTEEFGRTFNIEKQGLHKKTSMFDPVLAELMYKWFCKPDGKVLDPFGGEQTKGIVAGILGLYYTGVEIRYEQVEVNNKQAELLPTVHYVHGDSTMLDSFVFLYDYDMLLTSPPYFNLEEYSKSDLSSLDSYLAFMDSMKTVFSQCFNHLLDDTFAVVKVGEIRDNSTGEMRGFVPDMINMMKDVGWKYYNEIILINQSGTAAIRTAGNMKSRKIVKCHQNILVFYKGDTTKIKERYEQLR